MKIVWLLTGRRFKNPEDDSEITEIVYWETNVISKVKQAYLASDMIQKEGTGFIEDAIAVDFPKEVQPLIEFKEYKRRPLNMRKLK